MTQLVIPTRLRPPGLQVQDSEALLEETVKLLECTIRGNSVADSHLNPGEAKIALRRFAMRLNRIDRIREIEVLSELCQLLETHAGNGLTVIYIQRLAPIIPTLRKRLDELSCS